MAVYLLGGTTFGNKGRFPCMSRRGKSDWVKLKSVTKSSCITLRNKLYCNNTSFYPKSSSAFLLFGAQTWRRTAALCLSDTRELSQSESVTTSDVLKTQRSRWFLKTCRNRSFFFFSPALVVVVGSFSAHQLLSLGEQRFCLAVTSALSFKQGLHLPDLFFFIVLLLQKTLK